MKSPKYLLHDMGQFWPKQCGSDSHGLKVEGMISRQQLQRVLGGGLA